MTLPFHSDESEKLDDEWLTYGRTPEARAIRLHFAWTELKRAAVRGWRRGLARRQEQTDQEGGQL